MFKQLKGLLPCRFPPPVLDTIETDKVFRNRSKITPHYDVLAPNKAPKRAQGRGNARSVGFKKKASCQLVDVPYCHIATLGIIDTLCCARKEKQEEARQGVAEEAQQGRDAPAQGF